MLTADTNFRGMQCEEYCTVGCKSDEEQLGGRCAGLVHCLTSVHGQHSAAHDNDDDAAVQLH